MHQVVRALLDNALTHTPEGTRVTLRTWAEREHACSRSRTTDQVSGLSMRHVFDRFCRSESGTIASGSGLGLAIARELVHMMGGEVVLESRPGRTVVRVVLGAAPTSVAAESVTAVFT